MRKSVQLSIAISSVLIVNYLWWFAWGGYVRGLFPDQFNIASGNSVFGIKHIFRMIQQYSFDGRWWLMQLIQTIKVFSPPIFALMFMGMIFGAFYNPKNKSGIHAKILAPLLTTAFFVVMILSWMLSINPQTQNICNNFAQSMSKDGYGVTERTDAPQ